MENVRLLILTFEEIGSMLDATAHIYQWSVRAAHKITRVETSVADNSRISIRHSSQQLFGNE